MCHGWRIKYLLIGGGWGGCAFNGRTESGHSNGRCVMLPGLVISVMACSVAFRTVLWPFGSFGCPKTYPNGYSMAVSLGTLTAAVRSGMPESVIVLIPAASNFRCTSPTDQQQTGQTGIKITRFTPSCLMLWIMAGTLSFNSFCGCRIYPI